MVFILDASKYQGSINWPQVRSGGCLGAIIKVGQGRTADPDWRINHDGARAAGIPVAPYYFSNDGNAASDASWLASGRRAGTGAGGWTRSWPARTRPTSTSSGR
jgi:GH25 family lysozyme M1 (1,4-beta-N-acetylmuramidase)